MASILRMPGISADAEEAVLLEWALAAGAVFHPGDMLATVETEKANVDIESDQDAVLWRTLAEPGTSVTVGAPIAILLGIGEEAADEAAVFGALGLSVPGGAAPAAVDPVPAAVPAPAPAPAVPAPAAAAPAPAAAPAEAVAVAAAVTQRPEGARVFASPIARRLVRENALDVDLIEGTGPGGRIVRADVERAVQAAAEAPVPLAPEPAETPAATASNAATVPTPARTEPAGTVYTDVPHTGMRRAVARLLTQSKREAPHFYLEADCRVDALLALRAELNTDAPVRISINDFVVKAAAKTLAEVPELNVIWTDDAVRRFESVDISVAIGTEKGLVTPVIRAAETLSLSQISARVREFAGRAVEGRLKQNELEGGSFTVTNLGMFGVERFAAIINPPQSGILAVGAVVQKPVVVDGAIQVASMMSVTMSVDHRPVDGVVAARWLQRFTQLIENPLRILS